MAKNIDIEVVECAIGHIYEVDHVLKEVIEESGKTYLNGEFETLNKIVGYLNGLKKEMKDALEVYS